MIRIWHYRAVTAVLFISAAFFALKNYNLNLNIMELNREVTCFQTAAEDEKFISSSSFANKLLEYDNIDIVKLEQNSSEKGINTALVEFKGELKQVNEVFNEISSWDGIKSIKNINASVENNETKIRADINYFPNIICK